MTDFKFWTMCYEDHWDQSSEVEIEVRSLQGYSRVDAHFNVVGTNIILEINELPLNSVGKGETVCVSPGNVQNVKQNVAYDTWGVHHIPERGLLRVVPIDAKSWTAVDAGRFCIVTSRIRGVQGRYGEITAAHRCVKPYSLLAERLKKA
jgi:hypothetical protein